jgi:hypothetical protein
MTVLRPRLLLVLLACALCLAGCGGARPAAAGAPRGHRLLTIFQDNALLASEPNRFIATLRGLGVNVLRTGIYWSSIAPDPTARHAPRFDASDPASYPANNWAPWDQIDVIAHQLGITPFFTLTGDAPDWATPGSVRYRGRWEPSAAMFEQFVRAVGTRYSGHYIPRGFTGPLPRVNFWSIWNEPNNGVDLAPQAIDANALEVSPRVYRSLVDAAWQGLTASGHTPATDTILIGDLAPHGTSGLGSPGVNGQMFPVRFARALYCLGGDLRPLTGAAAAARGCPTTGGARARFAAAHPGLFDASGFAVHPYEDRQAPDQPTPGATGAGFADFATLPHLTRVLDHAAAVYGVGWRLPLYNTEFGYHTNPPGDQYFNTLPLATAAAYMNETEYLSWRNPRIRSFDQYLLADPARSTGSQFVTGLAFVTGVPKPIYYDAFRLPLWLPRTSAPGGSALRVWGCARPFNQPANGGARTVAIQFATTAAGPWRSVARAGLTRAGGCYFDVAVRFPGSGFVRLAYRVTGAVFHSRTQEITL